MKRLLITITLSLLCIRANSQTPAGEIILTPLPDTNPEINVPPVDYPELAEHYKLEFQHGITVGYLNSSAKFITQNGRQHIRGHSGFTAGWNISLPFAEVWSFDTGVMFSLWGFRYETSEMKINDNRYMLEIPVTLTFFERDAYFPIFLQAGILTGVCTGGSQKVTTYNDKIWDAPAAGTFFSRISCGFVFGIGYDHFTVQFINNFTGIWSRNMTYQWESFTENTLDVQTPRALCLTYTYWF